MKKILTFLALLALTVPVQSQTGEALNFDGLDDYIFAGYVIPGGSSYTKEAWIYANANTSNNIISSSSSPFWLNSGYLKMYSNGNSGNIIADPTAFPLNQWVHVAATYNSVNHVTCLYRNGVMVATGTVSGNYSGDIVGIGQYGYTGHNFFQGSMDEVRIWSRPLCQAEIQNNMNAELTLPQNGLLAYYNFNEGIAGGNNSAVITATDATSNGNNGDLYSFAFSGSSSNWIAPGAVVTGSVAPTFTAPAITAGVASQTNVTCPGGNDGVVTVTASAGSTFYWLHSGSSSSVAAYLAQGEYTCVVTSVCNVTTAVLATVTQPSPITASITASNPPCQLGYGSATVSATGGSGSYTYLWSTNDNSSSISFVHAGSYWVIVSDAICSNISYTANTTLYNPPAIYYTFGSNGIPCHGGTGSGFVSATGGSGTFSYLWSNGATTPTISSLLPGVYTVTVTDTYSCSNNMGFTLTDPPVLTASVAVTNPLCNGGTGSGTIVPNGGGAPYTYTLGATPTNTWLTNLSSGNYTVTLQDANGCVITPTFAVVAPSAPTIAATASSNSVCAGNSTTLTANGTGGTGAFTYTWTGAAAPGSSYTISPSVNTIYTVSGRDANACAASRTIAITAAALPTVIASNTAICAGASLTIVPGGASTYTISGGSFTVSPSANTSYSITGTGTNGCVSASAAVMNVTVNAVPAISVNSATICSGASVAITPTGAGTGATYTIQGSSFTVTPLATTSYSVKGTSSAGCVSNSVAATVSVNATPTLIANSASICAGNSVVITPAGAVSYSITGNTFTVSPAATTSYSITGTGTNNCVSAPAVVNVTVNALPVVALNNPVICAGATAVITPSGAATYTISGNSFSVSPANNTSYSVTGTSTAGCVSAMQTATVTVNANPTITVNNPGACAGASAVITPSGAISYTISGGSFTVSPAATASYTVAGTDANGCVSGAATTTVTINANPTVSVNSGAICHGNSFVVVPTGAAAYTITGGNFTVTPSATASYTVSGSSAAGCVSADAVSQVTVNALPNLTTGTSAATICVGESASLTVNGASTYSWNTAETTSVIVINPAVAGTAVYTVSGVDANGCANTTTVSQLVDNCTGIRSVQASALVFNVYPNPTTGQFTIESAQGVEISILNTVGQVVYSTITIDAKAAINIENLASGIYFVKASSQGNQQVMRLIKE